MGRTILLQQQHQRFRGFHYPDDVRAIMAAIPDRCPVSLKDLASSTGLPVPKILQLAAALEAQNLIVADGADQSEAALSRQSYRINPDGAHAIGICIGDTLIRLAILDLERKVRHCASCLASGKTAEDVMDWIAGELKLASEGKGINLSRLEGICLSSIDHGKPSGFAKMPPLVLPLMSHLQRALSLTFRVPIFTEDQIVATALGSAFLRRSRPADTFFYVVLNRDLPCGLFAFGEWQCTGAMGCLPLTDPMNSNLSDNNRSLSDWFEAVLATQASPANFAASTRQAAMYLMVPLTTLISIVQPTVVYLGGLTETVTASICRHINEMKEQFLPPHLGFSLVEPIAANDDEYVVATAALPFLHGLFQPINHKAALREEVQST